MTCVKFFFKLNVACYFRFHVLVEIFFPKSSFNLLFLNGFGQKVHLYFSVIELHHVMYTLRCLGKAGKARMYMAM